MELRAYLHTLISKWWIVLITFLVTYGATLAFTFKQEPVYQGRATYVVTLNTSFRNNKDLASAVDILSRRTEIATTYTMVANSRLIKLMAADALGLSPEQKSTVMASSQLLPGTNVLEVTGQARDPVLARDFTNAVGAQLVAYAQGLYETYKLEPLDQASVPDEPIQPKKLLNLMLGGIMGLVLGVGLAFLAAYLQAPPETVANASILDDETGMYSRRYLVLRLRQELSRAKRNGYCLSVAAMNIDHQGVLNNVPAQIHREVLRAAALRLAAHLRDEDIMAHFDNTVFAFLLPDMPGDMAKATLERLQTVVAGSAIELERSALKLALHCCTGLASYTDLDEDTTIESDVLLDQALRALKRAETMTYGKVYFLSDTEGFAEPASTRSMVSV